MAENNIARVMIFIMFFIVSICIGLIIYIEVRDYEETQSLKSLSKESPPETDAETREIGDDPVAIVLYILLLILYLSCLVVVISEVCKASCKYCNSCCCGSKVQEDRGYILTAI